MVQQAYPEVSVRQLCRWLGVSRSWYYACGTAEQKEQDVALRDAIEQFVLEFPGYGYRRVTQALRRAGWQVNHKRVLRLMREESLLCHLQRHFVGTTDSAHGYRTYPNLLAQAVLRGVDQAWVAEIV
jgi:putative transposase